MNINTELQADHRARLTVEFDQTTLESAKQRAGRKLAGRIKIPGFRPGKAPYPIVLRQVGEGAILEQAIEDLVDQEYKSIIDQAGIKPYGSGSLENVVATDPLTLEFLVPLAPEVTLGDYHSLHRDYNPDTVTEADHERVVQGLLERQAVLEPVEGIAQESNMVSIKISGEKVEAEDAEPEQGSLVLFEETSRDLLIRPNDDPDEYEWPYKGFSRSLIGLGAGEGKTVLHTFPEDYRIESLRGVEARYDFVVEQVRSRRLPELNDEFAASVGDFDNLDALNAAVQQSLENQNKSDYNETYDEAVIHELIDISTFAYPPEALEDEQTAVIDGFVRRLEQQGMSLDLYLKSRSMDMDAFKEETRPAAEHRLKHLLVLTELAKQENIVLDPSEVDAQAQNTLQYLSYTTDKAQARLLKDERYVRNIVSNIATDMMLNKAMERLRGIASGTYPPAETEPVAEAPAEMEPAFDENVNATPTEETAD